MHPIPDGLIHELSQTGITIAQDWWSLLPVDVQTEIIGLFDTRHDECFWGGARSEDEGTPPPLVIGGRFIPREDDMGLSEWGKGYFEHLLQHPELLPEDQSLLRTFHICTQHELARQCLVNRLIPIDFVCPVNSVTCPMHQISSVAPGHSVKLTPIVANRLILATPID